MSDSGGSETVDWSVDRILGAVDLGPISPDIIRWSGLFGSTFGSQIEVFHVYWFDYPPYITQSLAESLLSDSELRRKAIEEELSTLAKEYLPSKAKWSLGIAEGQTTTALLARLEAEPVDLVALGSHGRSGIARLMLGSVAESLIRSVTIPVLVIRSGSDTRSEPAVREIMVPVNFTSHSKRGVEIGAYLASKFGARLHIIHALEGQGFRKDTLRQLCDWVPSSSREQCEIKEVVREGNAAEQVVLAAREESVDLVVLGAEHRPFLEFTTLGTTAERVVRHCPCSTLVLPLPSRHGDE
jgi:nucleotide-binding universal stress UspA family protein